jgi:hypothetical protein
VNTLLFSLCLTHVDDTVFISVSFSLAQNAQNNNSLPVCIDRAAGLDRRVSVCARNFM